MDAQVLKEIERFYSEVSETFSTYQKKSGLTCIAECGRCCLNPEVEASPIETLPVVIKIIKGEIPGGLDFWQKELATKQSCAFYKPIDDEGKGFCGVYFERPLLCRVFGAAKIQGKDGQPALSICKYIKEAHPDKVQEANKDIEMAPDINQTCLKILQIFPDISQKRMPVNKAALQMLEKMSIYIDYSCSQS